MDVYKLLRVRKFENKAVVCIIRDVEDKLANSGLYIV